MSTWEERMSQRAKARQAAREAAEVEAREQWERQEVARWEKILPALSGEDRELEGPHAGHLTHWCVNSFMCSCGQSSGVACIVISDDYEPKPCEICKARQIGEWASEGTTPTSE